MSSEIFVSFDFSVEFNDDVVRDYVSFDFTVVFNDDFFRYFCKFWFFGGV